MYYVKPLLSPCCLMDITKSVFGQTLPPLCTCKQYLSPFLATKQGLQRQFESPPFLAACSCMSAQALSLSTTVYRVVQKCWCQVVRKIQPSYSQPKQAMPGWCLTKQSLFYAQRCTLYTHARIHRTLLSLLLLRVICAPTKPGLPI